MTLKMLRITGQVFHRMLLSWDFSDIETQALGRKTTEVRCHSCHIISWVNAVTVGVDLVHH